MFSTQKPKKRTWAWTTKLKKIRKWFYEIFTRGEKQEKTIICVKINWISVESEKWFSSLAMTAKMKLLHSIVLVK